jgi:rhodanese-related sulfurtransferase
MTSPSPKRGRLETIPRIPPGDAHRLVADGNAVLVDTRDSRYFREAHAEGAISAPLDAIREDPTATPLKDLRADQSIILYCT